MKEDDDSMSAPTANAEWWNLPFGQMPETGRLEELPPLLQALVRRNASLRRQVLDCHAQIKSMGPEKAHEREMEIQTLKAALRTLQESLDAEQAGAAALRAELAKAGVALADLEGKLENFRGMIQRRDEKIAKLRG